MDVRCHVKFGSFEIELEIDGKNSMYLAVVGSLLSKIIENNPFM